MNRNSLNPDPRTAGRSVLPRSMLGYLVTALACCWLNVAQAQAQTPAQTQEAVATATEIGGNVFATQAGGTMRRVTVNAPLYTTDRVVTARGAQATIRFNDDTELRLGARTIINIDAFSFDRDSASQRPDQELRTSVLAGVVRTLTGLLARRDPQRVRFNTPSATIGVRGTHFVTEVDGEEVTVVLLEQETPAASNAVVVANDHGTVEVNQTNWGTTVANANSAPTPPRAMRTQTMNRMLRNVDTTRRIGAPRMPVR